MSVGEYTASTLAMDMDQKEDEKEKKKDVDYSKIKSEIDAAIEAGKQVRI